MSWDDRDSDNLDAIRQKISPSSSDYGENPPEFGCGCLSIIVGVFWIWLATNVQANFVFVMGAAAIAYGVWVLKKNLDSA